jgi:hypothetical protein
MDRLIRAGELADAAELTPVEVAEPAVGAALGPVKLGDGDTLAVELLSLPEDLVRADLCTEVAALAPGLVDSEFHESAVLSYYVFTDLKKNLFFVLRVIRPEAEEERFSVL